MRLWECENMGISNAAKALSWWPEMSPQERVIRALLRVLLEVGGGGNNSVATRYGPATALLRVPFAAAVL